MKATMRFSFGGNVYDKGQDVNITNQDELDYLKGKNLISGIAPDKLEDAPKPLNDEEIAALQTGEKKKVSTKAAEKKEITAP